MDMQVLKAFEKAMVKQARSAAELLAAKAVRKGVDPTHIPAIKQVASAASDARPRAAQIAQNVRGFLNRAA